jgi:hypothetical protein
LAIIANHNETLVEAARSIIAANHSDTVVIALPRPGGRPPRPAAPGTRAAMGFNHNETLLGADRPAERCERDKHEPLTRRGCANHNESLLAGTRGGIDLANHNETLLAGTRSGVNMQHNETLLAAEHDVIAAEHDVIATNHSESPLAGTRSGLNLGNHNETLLAAL